MSDVIERRAFICNACPEYCQLKKAGQMPCNCPRLCSGHRPNADWKEVQA